MEIRILRLAIMALLCLSLTGGATAAEAPIARSAGQTVYVPIYSHIYSGDRERAIDLAATLSIRNVDPDRSIFITAVEYYNSDGKLLKSYLSEPLELDKMATVRYVVKQSDKEGGSGANFIVKWHARQAVIAPLIESVMISAARQIGISFTSRGVVISERAGVGRKNLSDIPPDQRP